MRQMFIVLATLLVACYAQDQPEVEQFAAGNIIASSRLYKELVKSSDADNFIVSPFSLQVAMALTEAGAKGQTAQEIITGLSLPNTTEAIETALKSLLPSFKTSNDKLQLLTANKIFADVSLPVKDTYKTLAEKVFQAGADNVNFVNTLEAAATINSWVAEQTNNKVQNLVGASALTDAKAVLVNTLYFMGQWSSPFGKKDYSTTVDKFYKTSESSFEVDMMHVQNDFAFYESATHQAKFVELPFEQGVTMTLILPNEVQGLSKLQENVETLFQAQPMERKSVYVSLPRWDIETQLDVTTILENLGITTAFSAAADLSGISDEPLMVSKVIQKAFINVTETGVEAAAGTAVITPGAVLPPPNPEVFYADHPFLYYIKADGVIVFVGKTAGPTVHN